MLTIFEIRAPASPDIGYTKFQVVQGGHDVNGCRQKPVTMLRTNIGDAISIVVRWVGENADCTGWITYSALEHWLASWASSQYFKETGIDWDPNAGDPDADNPNGVSTNPIDRKLTAAVHGLGKRLAHKPMPIAVAQVIEAYTLAFEYDALVDYLKSINAQTVTVML